MMAQKQNFTSKDIASQIEALEAAAYQRGWTDAIEAVKTAASKVKSPVKIQIVEKRPNAVSAPELKSGSMIESVLQYIKANPGKTRPELGREMLEKGFSSSEQSLRTSMKRLIRKRLVDNREGRLY